MCLEFRRVLFRSSLHDALPISSRRRHTRFLNVTGVQTCALPIDRKSTRLNSSHIQKTRMPSSAWKKKKDDAVSNELGRYVDIDAQPERLSARRPWWPAMATPVSTMVSLTCEFFFFNDRATTEIYTNLNTLSLHDALPIYPHPLSDYQWPVLYSILFTDLFFSNFF